MRIRGIIVLFAITIMSVGCTPTRQNPDPDSDVLLNLDDSVLTLSHIKSLIPSNLNPDDSARMARELIYDWLQERLLAKEVKEETPIEFEIIEKRVSDYRTSLLSSQYLKILDSKKEFSMSEDSIKAYFALHSNQFILKRPLIKGMFVRIDASSPYLNDVRKWMKNGLPKDIARIEKYAMRDVISIEYFNDNWIDIATLSAQFPSGISDNSYTSIPSDLEISDARSVFILHISSVIKAGSKMPYEYAAPRIREIFRASNRRKSEEALVKRLYDKAVSEGRLIQGKYLLENHN